jgi:hypothetical protein
LHADIIAFEERQADDTIDARLLLPLSIRKQQSATIASVAVPYQATLLLASDSRFRSPSLPGVGEFAFPAGASVLTWAVQIGAVMTTGMASHERTKVMMNE